MADTTLAFTSPEPQSSPAAAADARRRGPRLKVPAMYTLLRVRLPGDEHYRWSGHIYDISLTGMRFELDEPLAPGTPIEVRAMLPGQRHTVVRAAGHIVRYQDDEPTIAPVRMAMCFDAFTNTIDHYRLSTYLAAAGLKRAEGDALPLAAAQRPAA